jgi:hypothetical protein
VLCFLWPAFLSPFGDPPFFRFYHFAPFFSPMPPRTRTSQPAHTNDSTGTPPPRGVLPLHPRLPQLALRLPNPYLFGLPTFDPRPDPRIKNISKTDNRQPTGLEKRTNLSADTGGLEPTSFFYRRDPKNSSWSGLSPTGIPRPAVARLRGCRSSSRPAPPLGVWPALWILPTRPFRWPVDGESGVFESGNGDLVNPLPSSLGPV